MAALAPTDRELLRFLDRVRVKGFGLRDALRGKREWIELRTTAFARQAQRKGRAGRNARGCGNPRTVRFAKARLVALGLLDEVRRPGRPSLVRSSWWAAEDPRAVWEEATNRATAALLAGTLTPYAPPDIPPSIPPPIPPSVSDNPKEEKQLTPVAKETVGTVGTSVPSEHLSLDGGPSRASASPSREPKPRPRKAPRRLPIPDPELRREVRELLREVPALWRPVAGSLADGYEPETVLRALRGAAGSAEVRNPVAYFRTTVRIWGDEPEAARRNRLEHWRTPEEEQQARKDAEHEAARLLRLEENGTAPPRDDWPPLVREVLPDVERRREAARQHREWEQAERRAIEDPEARERSRRIADKLLAELRGGAK